MSILRLLWLSTAPNWESGYSRVTRNVVSRLSSAGYDIIIYSLVSKGKPHTISYKGESYRIVCCEDLDTGSDADIEKALLPWLKHHFKYTDRTAIITLRDVWALPDKSNVDRTQVSVNNHFSEMFETWMPYIPLDASPITRKTYDVVKGAFRRIAMSKFGRQELNNVGLDSTIIYHGVDTKLFKPIHPQEKAGIRLQMGIPIDAFVFGYVAKNIGDRKRMDRAIRIWDIFQKKNRLNDAYFYLHTERVQRKFGMGYNIDEIVDRYSAQNVIVPQKINLDESILAKIMAIFDVYFSTSAGEGFGLPLIESQACGVPCIVADNSAQTELVKGHGWIVPCTDHDIRLTSPKHDFFQTIDIDEAVLALEEAYCNRKKVIEYGETAYEFAQSFNWDSIVEHQWIPFLERADHDIQNNSILMNYINGIKRWPI